MKSICIKSNNPYLIDYLLKDFLNMKFDHVYLSNRTFKIYDNVILHYTGEELDYFYDFVCDRLTKCILFFYEKKMIKSMLQYNYFYFNDLEKQEITNNCLDLLQFDDELFCKKYQKIFQSLKEYLVEHRSIVVNGFVNFRLKSYRNLIDENIDLCVSNFLIEREYYEFINILHLYVNSKEATMDTVHLVYTNKECILLDQEKNIIPMDPNLLDAKYLSDISFSSNDYCLNALLNILPKKLYIHLIGQLEDEFITTLKLIFENRISICMDCDICHVYRLTNNVMAKE